MVIVGSVALETVIGTDEAAVVTGAVGAGAIGAVGVDDAGGSDATWARRRVSTCTFRPPWGRPRSQQSCTMVALYAESKSSARSRSDGDGMIQYGRSGREGSGAHEAEIERSSYVAGRGAQVDTNSGLH